MAITQARYSSSRLKGKVLLPLGEQTVLDHHWQHLKRSNLINQFVLATTIEKQSSQIIEIAKRIGNSSRQAL